LLVVVWLWLLVLAARFGRHAMALHFHIPPTNRNHKIFTTDK